MKKDLRNLRRLAEFLQKTEFKFDLLSAIIELQKQIGNEFDFVLEAKNMNMIRKGLQSTVPEVVLPKPIWVSKRVLVMSFIEGPNLGKLAEFRDKAWNNNQMPRWLKQKFAMNLLNTLSKVICCFTFHFFLNHDIISLTMFLPRRGESKYSD
jgi:predicted unusual protein kinase regulating ubiquinone biosynthesis (AarF/ABC1/UbiB family)